MKMAMIMLAAACAGLISSGAFASEEEYLPWTQARIESAGDAETGKVVFSAKTDGTAFREITIQVFGKEHQLGKDQLLKLQGFALAGLVITHEGAIRNWAATPSISS